MTVPSCCNLGGKHSSRCGLFHNSHRFVTNITRKIKVIQADGSFIDQRDGNRTHLLKNELYTYRYLNGARRNKTHTLQYQTWKFKAAAARPDRNTAGYPWPPKATLPWTRLDRKKNDTFVSKTNSSCANQQATVLLGAWSLCCQTESRVSPTRKIAVLLAKSSKQYNSKKAARISRRRFTVVATHTQKKKIGPDKQ